MRMKDRVALVTGVGGPMGAAVATRLGEEGAKLIVTDISGRRLEERAKTLPGNPVVLRADNRLEEENARVVEAGLARFGRIDVLVNVVGGIRDSELYRPLLEMTETRWNETFDLNLKGLFHLTRLVAPGMVARRYGRIVNFSSINMAGEIGQADYGAAKAAVASLTRSLAMELAPHVTVNCIAPALIRTTVMERSAPEVIERYKDMTRLKRLGEPRDVANAALFFASDEASFITGEMLAVSGGIWPSL